MPRFIKEVIIGGPDSAVIKEDWNITPITTVTTPDVEIIETYQGTNNNGLFEVDVTGVTVASYVSVAKTNITLNGLGTDRTFKFGMEVIQAADPATPYAFGIYIAPPERTAQQVSGEIFNALFNGQGPLNNRIMHYVLSFSGTKQFTTMYKIPNAATPNGVTGTVSGTVNTVDVTDGAKTALVLSKRNNNLYVGRFDVSSDDISYDLNGREAVVNGPVLPETHRVYYFTLLADNGGGLSNTIIRPDLTIDPPGFDITGTSAEAIPFDWNTYFDNPVRPNYSSTAQVTLPVDARIGQFYRTVIDPGYAGPTPTPYGYPLKNNQTILINSISGLSANLTAYVDNEVLVLLVNDITQPIIDQQTTMLQSIQDIGLLLDQTQQDVNVALLNTEELVCYVKAPLLAALPEPEFEFSTSVTFDTFHEAYTYLIGLPKFIKKRIVFDDRTAPITEIIGETGVVYDFLRNNITLSSYTRFHGIKTSPVVYLPDVTLILDCTGLRLDRFNGKYFKKDTPIPDGGLLSGLPIQTTLAGRVHLENNVSLYIDDTSIGLVQPSYFILGEDSNLTLAITQDLVASNYYPITFYKGNNSSVTVQQTLVSTHPSVQFFFLIFTPHDNKQDTIGFDEAQILYNYTTLDPYYYAYQGYQVIRQLSDLGAPDYLGRFILYASKYLFVSSLYLGERYLLIPYSTNVEIRALDGVEIFSGNRSTVDIRGTLIDHGVSFKSVSSTPNIPVIANYGKYYRKGGKLTGRRLFTSYPDPFYNSPTVFHMLDVEHVLPNDETLITEHSQVGLCTDFLVKDYKFNGFLDNIALIELNINSLDLSQRYTIDGLYGKHAIENPTLGIVNIVNGYAKANTALTEVIKLTNVKILPANGTRKYPLITKDGQFYAYKSDPAILYDDKQYTVVIIDAAGAGAGTSLTTADFILNQPAIRYIEGFIDSYPLFSQAKIGIQKYLVTIKANVYATNNNRTGRVGILYGQVGNSLSVKKQKDVTLITAGVRYPIEFKEIVELDLFDVVGISGLLIENASAFLYFEDLEFTVIAL